MSLSAARSHDLYQVRGTIPPAFQGVELGDAGVTAAPFFCRGAVVRGLRFLLLAVVLWGILFGFPTLQPTSTSDTFPSASRLLAQSSRNGTPKVHLDLLTESGFPLGGERRWVEALRPIRNVQIRIRQAQGGDEPRVDKRGSDAVPIFYVTGILTARNELRVPGGRFRLTDRAGIEAWLTKLRAEGVEGATAERGAFGMTATQLVAAHDALSIAVSTTTRGKEPQAVVAEIGRTLPYSIMLGPGAPQAFRKGSPVQDELEGLTAGTALAAVLRPLGLVLTLDKPLGKDPRLQIVDYQSTKETWPIGWPSEQSPRKTAPKLFEFLTVEIQDIPLSQALDALQSRIELPLLIDHNALARKQISLEDTKVSFPQGRSFYKGIFDRLLIQARLKGELRVDEAQTAFLWITTIRP